MTDPVRPVAPREDELRVLEIFKAADEAIAMRARKLSRYRTAVDIAERKGLLFALERLKEARDILAAAPVPCAASPADLVAEIAAILDDFAPLHDGETKTLPQRLRDEIHDFSMVMDHCSEVYVHFSGGAISKPNTLPREVITLAGDLETERTNEAIAEAREEWEALRATGEGARDGNTEHGSRTTDRSDHAGNSGTHQARTATAGESSLQPRVVKGAGDSDESAPVAVSLDPHRLRVVLGIALASLEEMEDMLHLWMRDNTGPRELDVLERCEQAIARLRGEATVRPKGKADA